MSLTDIVKNAAVLRKSKKYGLPFVVSEVAIYSGYFLLCYNDVLPWPMMYAPGAEFTSVGVSILYNRLKDNYRNRQQQKLPTNP
jgi:hypothetical protein